ncbi:unnamed protein product, partial [Allacma fusca]
SGIYDLR